MTEGTATALSTTETAQPGPFEIRDCSLLAQVTSIRVRTLRELRHGLSEAPIASVYHHFWGRFLRPQFDEPDYSNDFASWVQRALNDKALAERLSAVNPVHFDGFEQVRDELVDLLEARLAESDTLAWAPADNEFSFIESQLVVFDTGQRLEGPGDLVSKIGHLSDGAIFYHFIDAQRRTEEHRNDFSEWIPQFGEEWQPLADALRAVDPYFFSLSALRRVLDSVCGVDRSEEVAR